MITITQNAFDVSSVDDWFSKYPPQRPSLHWRDGKSAKEHARAWFPPNNSGPVVPLGMDVLLLSHPLTHGMIIEKAVPEMLVTFDNRGGGRRNTDLGLLGISGINRVAVSIEAKTDEHFGNYSIDGQFRRCSQNAQQRIIDLCYALFSVARHIDIAKLPTHLLKLRYQLLFSMVATIVWALQQHANVAVLAVHELLPRDLNYKFRDENDGQMRGFSRRQIETNHNDLAAFFTALSGGPTAIALSESLLDLGEWKLPDDFVRTVPQRPENRTVRLLAGMGLTYTA